MIAACISEQRNPIDFIGIVVYIISIEKNNIRSSGAITERV